MIPTQILVDQYRYQAGNMAKLVEEAAEADLAREAGGVRNHPAWTLLHCVVANGELLACLDKPRSHPEEWGAIASPGSAPANDLAHYPPRDEVLAVFRKQVELVDAGAIDAVDLSAPYPNEALRPYFPTRAHGTAYFLTDHITHHLGQLLAWRRALQVERGDA